MTEADTELVKIPIILNESEIGNAEITFTSNHIDEKLAHLRNLIIMIYLIVMIFSSGTTYTFTSGVVKPLQKLSEEFVKIAEGDLTSSIEIKSNDEIGILAREFNNFIEKLNITVSKVKKYVCRSRKRKYTA